MKFFFCLAIALLLHMPFIGQEPEQEPEQATGEAAVQSVEVVKENNWQNWAFAGSAVVTAATAIFVVSLQDGSEAH